MMTIEKFLITIGLLTTHKKSRPGLNTPTKERYLRARTSLTDAELDGAKMPKAKLIQVYLEITSRFL